ncbi:MAG: alpha-amylase family protein [Prevotellaceae bacterium]|jgi:glycosidase|nr:alpha-amylase family protein [Prevotellaceae bacterium]
MKTIIYQVLPRLFGNNNHYCICNGSMAENGCGKLADFTPHALAEIRRLGITHIWYTGIIEHATQTDYRRYNITPDHPAVVKGKAGSPYAIKDYYDIDPDLAVDVPERMREFEELVKRTHDARMKVIIDFVPNHVARQYHSDAQPDGTTQLGANDDTLYAFSPYNNFYYIPNSGLHAQFDMQADADEAYREFPAKATGNNRFDVYPNVTDWYDTVKLNYGVDYQNGGTCHFTPLPDTWIKMLDILLFWASKQIDGFRCDMAEMVPVAFWEWAIPQVKSKYPETVFIAEVYNPAEYRNYLTRGKFDYLYDKVGLYDTLRRITCGYDSATAITRAWQSLDGIEKQMLNFLENHDEQRIASEYFAGNPRRAIPALIVAACLNTNPLMIYFGQEFGELGMDSEGFSGRDGRTSIFDYCSVHTIRCWRNHGRFDGKLLTAEQRALHDLYRRILTLSRTERAITDGAFFDLMYVNTGGWRFNEHKQYAFMRKADSELLFIVVNFDYIPVNVAVNIPSHAFDYLQIAQQEAYPATDLLTGTTGTIDLLPYKPAEFSVAPHSGKIIKIQLEPRHSRPPK